MFPKTGINLCLFLSSILPQLTFARCRGSLPRSHSAISQRREPTDVWTDVISWMGWNSQPPHQGQAFILLWSFLLFWILFFSSLRDVAFLQGILWILKIYLFFGLFLQIYITTKKYPYFALLNFLCVTAQLSKLVYVKSVGKKVTRWYFHFNQIKFTFQDRWMDPKRWDVSECAF